MDYFNSLIPSVSMYFYGQTEPETSGTQDDKVDKDTLGGNGINCRDDGALENSDNEHNLLSVNNIDMAKFAYEEEEQKNQIPSSAPSSRICSGTFDGDKIHHIQMNSNPMSNFEKLEYGHTCNHLETSKTISKSGGKQVAVISYDSEDEVEDILDRIDSTIRTSSIFLKDYQSTNHSVSKSSRIQMTGNVATVLKSRPNDKRIFHTDLSFDATMTSQSDASGKNCIRDLYSDSERRRNHRHIKRVAVASSVTLCVIILVVSVIVLVDMSKPGVDESDKSDLSSQAHTAAPTTPFRFVDMIPTSRPSNMSQGEFGTDSPTGTPSDVNSLKATFYVIGDLPYNDNERTRLFEHVKNIPDDAEFLVHVGDIRDAEGQKDCLLSEFEDVANILKDAKVPVLIVPGDNEYNDCPNLSESWGNWMDVFGEFDSNWDAPFQLSRDPERQESFFFVYKRVLYIGLNIVGGFRQDYNEWESRLSHQTEWTKNLIDTHIVQSPNNASSIVIFAHADPGPAVHASFFDPLKSYIANELKNEVPIIYVNGDKHYFQFDASFYGQPSFHRLMVEGGSTEPPLQMIISVPNSPDHGVLDIDGVYAFSRQL